MSSLANNNKTYLSFYLGKELFAADVKHILEVLKGEQITEIPRSSDFIEGIINFRGEIVTVINSIKKLNLPFITESRQNIIIVIELHYGEKNVKVGLLSDKVCKVFQIEDKELKAVPEFGHYYNPEYLTGVAKTAEGLNMILDLEKVLNDKDVQLLQKIEEKSK